MTTMLAFNINNFTTYLNIQTKYFPIRQLSTSFPLHGAKAKRRKQNRRVDMPHLPSKVNTAVPTNIALNHFDQFYSTVYKARWSSMRLGLLTQQKYAVMVNNFGDSEDTIAKLKDLGCVDINKEFTLAREQQEQFVRDLELKLSSVEADVSSHGEADPPLDSLIPPLLPDALTPPSSPDSLSLSEAEARLIKPEANVLGGGSMALHQFVPTKELKGMEEFVEESQYYEKYKKVDAQAIKVKACLRLNFPPHLRFFTFPRGNLSNFPSPTPGSLSTLNYYCMDAASLLPVLALDLKPGQAVLDLCAGPGGKSLAILQTMYAERITCNDTSHERVRRILGVLDQYVGRGDGVGGARKCVEVQKRDGAQICDYGTYDRVLVDAPCFSDRHAVTSEEGNVFVKTEIKYRLNMPEKQAELLKNGLLQLAPGGSLVYSTCTLSPVQNDGVVARVLGQIWEETNLDFEVADLSMAVKPFRFLCKLHGRKEGVKYGQMVVPFLPNNFGPMYFCKINRV